MVETKVWEFKGGNIEQLKIPLPRKVQFNCSLFPASANYMPFTGFIDIQYWFVWHYNMCYSICCNSIYVGGEHQGDIEGLTVRLNRADRKLQKIFYG